jgi:multisubunit Na+/H+ antiporter MnhB subunit
MGLLQDLDPDFLGHFAPGPARAAPLGWMISGLLEGIAVAVALATLGVAPVPQPSTMPFRRRKRRRRVIRRVIGAATVLLSAGVGWLISQQLFMAPESVSVSIAALAGLLVALALRILPGPPEGLAAQPPRRRFGRAFFAALTLGLFCGLFLGATWGHRRRAHPSASSPGAATGRIPVHRARA